MAATVHRGSDTHRAAPVHRGAREIDLCPYRSVAVAVHPIDLGGDPIPPLLAADHSCDHFPATPRGGRSLPPGSIRAEITPAAPIGQRSTHPARIGIQCRA